MDWERLLEEEAKAKAKIKASIRTRADIRKAMRDPELWVIESTYTDTAGNRTRRLRRTYYVVSERPQQCSPYPDRCSFRCHL